MVGADMKRNINLKQKRNINFKQVVIIIVIVLFVATIISTIGSQKTETTGTNMESLETKKEPQNKWILSNYIDEYGLPTNTQYVQSKFWGAFSNVATKQSSCEGYFLVNERNEIQIIIYEYGTYLASGFGRSDIYYMTVLDANTNEVLATTKTWHGDDRFFVEDSETIIQNLMNHSNILIRLNGGKYTNSTYLFELDTYGFSNTYQKMFA